MQRRALDVDDGGGTVGTPLADAARRAGVRDERVLAAVGSVDRSRFVPASQARRADEDRPLPTSGDQTTSQPSLIAKMLTWLHLEGHERVLEVGTGPGYQAALLGQLAGEVWTIERVPALAEEARRNLAAAGVDNVEVVVADGHDGYRVAAPFDRIIAAAACPTVPEAWPGQVVDGGWILAPVMVGAEEVVTRSFVRGGVVVSEERLLPVRFVPLLGGVVGDDAAPGSTTDERSGR